MPSSGYYGVPARRSPWTGFEDDKPADRRGGFHRHGEGCDLFGRQRVRRRIRDIRGDPLVLAAQIAGQPFGGAKWSLIEPDGSRTDSMQNRWERYAELRAAKPHDHAGRTQRSAAGVDGGS